MALVIVEKASLAFGQRVLLERVDFTLGPKEIVALIGRNGTGKSSLLKAIAGLLALDDGRIIVSDTVRLAYVPQESEFPAGQTVFEAVADGIGELKTLLARYHQLTQSLPLAGAATEKLLSEIEIVQHELEAKQGWQFNSLISSTLSHFGLSANSLTSDLSGGWKKRVTLARALACRPNVLLLDEPTNHLDVAAIEQLEELLHNFNGSGVLITHDRRLLNRVATRVVELDRGILRPYPGNFDAYQIEKEKELSNEEHQNRVFDKLHAQEEAWIRRGIEARRTRNMGRVRRLGALRQQRAARRDRIGRANFQLNAGERSGKLVAQLDHVSKSFGDNIIIRDFTTRLLRGDKVGLIGPNGVGKTTLLKLIVGELPPDSGTVRLGSHLQIAYFDQLREKLDQEARVVEVISQGNEFVSIGPTKKHVMSYLEDFLFSPQQARSPVRSLSGGERNRLLLARLFTRPANVLILDEPTNDLDIDTLELLEELVINYSGTIFLVSHDRTFLDNVVTQVIAFKEDGQLVESLGGYQDWERTRGPLAAARASAPARPDNITLPLKQPSKTQTARRNKLSYSETRQLAALPGEIAQLEQEQRLLTAKLLDPNCFRTHPLEARSWQTQIEALEALLLEKLTQWEELESRQL